MSSVYYETIFLHSTHAILVLVPCVVEAERVHALRKMYACVYVCTYVCIYSCICDDYFVYILLIMRHHNIILYLNVT